ncbi:hypothetical protein [Rufibacter latericius]|nr:hypothetical protein [Rufibacter latericius]
MRPFHHTDNEHSEEIGKTLSRHVGEYSTTPGEYSITKGDVTVYGFHSFYEAYMYALNRFCSEDFLVSKDS